MKHRHDSPVYTLEWQPRPGEREQPVRVADGAWLERRRKEK